MTIEELRSITSNLSSTLIALDDIGIHLPDAANQLLQSALQDAEVLEVMAGNNRYILPEGEGLLQRVGTITSKDLSDLGYDITDPVIIDRIASRVGWGYDAILETRNLALQVYLNEFYAAYKKKQG